MVRLFPVILNRSKLNTVLSTFYVMAQKTVRPHLNNPPAGVEPADSVDCVVLAAGSVGCVVL